MARNRSLFLRSKADLSRDRVCALKGGAAFYLVRLTLLPAGSLVSLLLLTRQFFLPLLVCLVSHRNSV